MALNAGRLRHTPWFVALTLLFFIPPASARGASGSIRFADSGEGERFSEGKPNSVPS